jgi:hypothetical protein
MLTTQTLVPQYLVCNWLAALALGLTGSQRQQGIKFFKEEFQHASKKETGEESCQEEKEVALERSQVSVNQGKIVMTGVQIEHPFLLPQNPGAGPLACLSVDASLPAK